LEEIYSTFAYKHKRISFLIIYLLICLRLVTLLPRKRKIIGPLSSPPYESPWVYFVFRTGYFVFFSVICPINFCSPQPTSGCVTNTSVWHFFFPVRPHVDQTTRSISHLLRPSFLQQIWSSKKKR